MSLQSATGPSSTVSFIIRNNSSINRTIKVFNLKLLPGQTVDLMSIPGVTEDDIRNELIRGSLRSLFAGKSLTVVSSTVNFSTADLTQAAFLSSIGLTSPNTLAAYQQPAWFISYLTGNDQNSGITLASPLKTFAEFFRRLGSNKITIPTMDITVIDHNIADAICGSIDTLGTVVTIHPLSNTVASTGSFSAVRTRVAATNTPGGVTDGVIAWTPGTRIRNTTAGARFGTIGWVAKDEGSGLARVGVFYNPTVGGIVVPLVSDTYAIDTLTSIWISSLEVNGTETSSGTFNFSGCFIFRDFTIQLGPVFGGFATITGNAAQGVTFLNSIISGPGTFFAQNTYLYLRGSFLNNVLLNIIGGYTTLDSSSALGVGNNNCGRVRLNAVMEFYNFLGQNHAFSFGNGANVSVQLNFGYGNFDAQVSTTNPSGDGLIIGDEIGGTWLGPASFSTSGTVWGSGNTGTGIRFGTNGFLAYKNAASIPTITGTSDFVMGYEAADGYAVANDPATYIQGAATACSWTNLNAAYASGTGFGGSCYQPNKNNRITRRTA